MPTAAGLAVVAGVAAVGQTSPLHCLGGQSGGWDRRGFFGLMAVNVM
jgi:hypothetical protein